MSQQQLVQPHTSTEGEYCRVHFRVRCNTSLGQDVGISGNIAALGHSTKSKFLRLYTTPESYPIWSALGPVLVPVDKLLSYKYCIVENGEFKSSEKCENRLIMPRIGDNYVEDDFLVGEVDGVNDTDMEWLSHSETKILTSTESHIDLTQVSNDARLVIVCYHLPVVIKRNPPGSNQPFTVNWAESLIAKSSDDSISSTFNTFWMGTMSIPEGETTEEDMKILMKLLEEMHCIPVNINPELATKAYSGFCKLIMWPIFHNVDQMDQIHAAWKLYPPDGQLKPEEPLGNSVLDWNSDIAQLEAAYIEMNNVFGKELEKWLQPEDTVWVHDYHLMFLPKLLRDLDRDVHIVFFLHIPFPTSQIYRSLPNATSLLHSMASADVVGFHTYDHARHFLTAMKRILGIRSHTEQGGILALDVQDREVVVTVSHVSVEVNDINKVLRNPDVWTKAKKYKELSSDRKIIVGLDVGQRLSGGVLKLVAYEKFLTDYPREVKRVVLMQQMIRSTSRVGDEATTSADMKALVDRINNKFSLTLPDGSILPAVIYDEVPLRSISLADRVALWLASDVFLLTPIKEGLNLYPLEYIYAREMLGSLDGIHNNTPASGVVVASEFSTCSSLLNGAIKINPYFSLSVADSIHKALYMSPTECQQRRQRDIAFISSHPSSQWTKEVLSDLRFASNSGFKHFTRTATTFHLEPLLKDNIVASFKEASHSSRFGLSDKSSRVFIFDYGGTLLAKERSDIYLKQSMSAISGKTPTDGMLKAIKELSNDPRNSVLIVTGLTKVKLADLFSDMPNVSIGTSNGLVHSWGANILTHEELDRIASGDIACEPSYLTNIMKEINKSSSRYWDSLHFDVNWEAVREIAVPILTKFAFRTNGTCLTPRIPGIGWSYFGADPEWGERQAAQCRIELEAALAMHDVKVVSQIQGSIEVVPKALDKGLIVEKFLERVQRKRSGLLPTFALSIGDDEADDLMHRAVYDNLVRSPSHSDITRARIFTTVVGKRECAAQYYVNEVKDVEDLLRALSEASSESKISPPSPGRMIIRKQMGSSKEIHRSVTV